MIFKSTRNNFLNYSFFDVLLKGMPVNGGLFVFDSVPKLNIKKLMSYDKYHMFFSYIFKKFLTSNEKLFIDINKISFNVFNKKNFYFNSFFKDILYLTPFIFNGFRSFFLDLTSGKTFSFKDFAVAFLSELLNSYLFKISVFTNVLISTSGDTGSSCEYFLRNSKFINTFCFSPSGLISHFQSLQMYSLIRPNIFNLKINGSFDDCQSILKSILVTSGNFTTLNSVNLIRIISQIVYYFRCFYHLNKYFSIYKKVIISVPTGNFGNAYSLYLSYKMGLPVFKIIVSNNENNTCYDVFNSFTLKSKSFYSTNSPSMDILIPSNLERYLFFKLNISNYLKYIYFFVSKVSVSLNLNNTLISSLFCLKYERKFLINSFFNSGYILDPHTANAVSYCLKSNISCSPCIFVCTAKYFKFLDKISFIKVYKKYKVFELLRFKRHRYFSFNKKDNSKILRFIIQNSYL